VNLSRFVSSRDRLMPWSGTGSHRSRVMQITGQLTDGSRGSRVTKCDPLSALILGNTGRWRFGQNGTEQVRSISGSLQVAMHRSCHLLLFIMYCSVFLFLPLSLSNRPRTRSWVSRKSE